MSHEMNVKVRFCETDALGHVNNTSYFIYMEEARVEFLNQHRGDSSTEDWKFILVSTNCDFHAQVYFGEILTVDTFIKKIGTKSFVMCHRMKNAENGTLVAEGESVIVYFNFKEQKSEQIPEELRKALEESFQVS